MRLFEHEDFETAVTAAAATAGLEESFVEKDYYITEVLRIVAGRYAPGQAIFKGGTSLSKAWGLIQRLSEDVDLLVVRDRFEPPLGRARVDRELLLMTEAIAAHPGLTLDETRTARTSGRARCDWFTFDQRFPRVGIAPSIISEPGVRGGGYPTVQCEIDSVVARHLRSAGQASIAEDLQPFALTVLHFRRTFVEKLFIVHALAERLQNDGRGLGRDARHYIDLHALAGEPDVEVMLRSPEYQAIKEDYEALSLQFFKKRYVRPPDLSFAQSPGVFPGASLRARITGDYDEQCRTLCYGPYPSFGEVVGRFEALRELL
ncbi:MAG: hypothetical protein QOJ25_2075 [Solirubrobacteraceae bacterium]|jgi:hypothetical protein|nr:hypothetical protein [Solirubrobacteraceae bacterium]